jgi:hypothetical protein
LLTKSAIRFVLRWNLLNKTDKNSNFALFPIQDPREKLIFEVLFKKFHPRINLPTLFLTKTYLLVWELVWEIWKNCYFIKFCSASVTIEQIWSHFYLTILYSKDNGILRILEFWVLRVPPIQIPTQNGEMKVLFHKFHRRINLVVLLFSNSGSRNKTTHLEFRNLKILRVFSY